MIKKESSFPNTTKEKYTNEKKQCEIEQKNDKNKYQINNSNINQMIYDNKDIDNDNETEEEIDNLKYKENIPNTINPFIQPLDSSDSPLPSYYKFSIDMPNVSKQRLHEYLNDDLLNAIESSPNIQNINGGIDIKKPEEHNKDKDLYGFSLYPSSNNNYIDSINNNTINDSLPYNYKNNNNIKENISNTIKNNNLNEAIDNNSNINFHYNKKNKSTNLNIGNTSINDTNNTFSKKTKKNKQLLPSNTEANINHLQISNTRDNKNKTNINNNNILNKQNNKKMKKTFVYRTGDWTCNQCYNLNFGFRNKCNRCGIPKELSLQINMQALHSIYNQNNNNNQMTINNGNSFIGKNNNNENYYQYHL